MGLIFSVSGVRGIVGTELTPQVAVDVGAAFGSWVGGGRVAVASDTRPSGPMIRRAVASGLMATGCTVIDLDVASTPGTALRVRELAASGGVVVTASHNPSEYNGIKLLSSDGWALPAEQVEQVRRIWQQRGFDLVGGDQVGGVETRQATETHQRHVEAVLRIVNVPMIAKRRLHIVLDSVNGAGSPGTAMLLARLGCEFVHINAEPTGMFARGPEPVAENLTELCQAVRLARADAGFAQDPDADRLALVDEAGRCVGEEYTLALAVQEVLSKRSGPVAANLSTSRLIDDIARRAGCTVHRTPVGEAHVAQAIIQRGCVIGGEGNGGVIDPRVVPVRDSFVAIALICQLLAESGKKLSELVAALPRYAMIKRKLACPAERAGAVLAAVREAFAGQRINEADGVWIGLQNGWVHVRQSNTEPIMRLVVEAEGDRQAQELVERVVRIAEAVR